MDSGLTLIAVLALRIRSFAPFVKTTERWPRKHSTWLLLRFSSASRLASSLD